VTKIAAWPVPMQRMSGSAIVGDHFRMSNDLVFDALEVFEKQRVVAGRSVFWIFAGRRDNYSPNGLQLSVESIDFGPRPGSKGKVVECPRFSSMNWFILEDSSRRRDGEGHPRMAVLDNVEFVRIYDRARFALGAEAKKRKELVVEGDSNRDVSNCDLYMIDYRLHSSSFSFGGEVGAASRASVASDPSKARDGQSAAVAM